MFSRLTPAALVFTLLPLGCARPAPPAPVATAGATTAAATADAGTVELSGPVVLLPDDPKNPRKGQGTKVISVEVKYRFTEGKPQPGVWYEITADLGYGFRNTLWRADGKDVKPEDTIQSDVALRKPGQKVAAYDIEMAAGPVRGPAKRISNTLKGKVAE